MANTYTQIYVMLVFAVKGKKQLIHPNIEEKIHKYISGTVKNFSQKFICINGMQDHVHILFSMTPKYALSDVVKEIKVSSSKMINEKKMFNEAFHWQTGFGAFSYSKSQLNDVIHYINTQKEHHKKVSFKDEYISLLKAFGIEYNENYVFEWN